MSADSERDIKGEEVDSVSEHLEEQNIPEVLIRKKVFEGSLRTASISAALEKSRVPMDAADVARKLSIGFQIPRTQLDAVLSGLHRSVEYNVTLNEMVEKTLKMQQALGAVAASRVLSNASLVAKAIDVSSYRLPFIDEISKFSRTLVLPKGFEKIISDKNFFISKLEAQMGSMQSPWLDFENASASLRSFTEIQALGVAVNRFDPYSIDASKFLRSELGDWREPLIVSDEEVVNYKGRANLYIEKGFKTGLVGIARPAFDETLSSAGLIDVSTPSLQFVKSDESLDCEGLARNRRAFDLLMVFEIKVRKFIVESMRTYYGDDWFKSQLPVNMLERWREKANTAVKNGAEPSTFELIDYADFTDYKAIIERSDNWKSIFKYVFVRPENIRESFQRLFPVRIATMHARIITQEDEIFLFSETRRVLNAIELALKKGRTVQ